MVNLSWATSVFQLAPALPVEQVRCSLAWWIWAQLTRWFRLHSQQSVVFALSFFPFWLNLQIMTPVHLVWNSVCKCTQWGSWSIALFSQQGIANCRNCCNSTTCWEMHQRRKTVKDIKFFGKLYKCDTQAHCWAFLKTGEEGHSDGHGSAEFYIRPTAGTLNSNRNYRDTYTANSRLKIQRSQLSHSHIVTHITKNALPK